jgi:asparagine synthase (glutamine-hydrolysing)
VFAFVCVNKDGSFIAARDRLGIRPLFYGYSKTNGTICFCSELKGLLGMCDNISEFPPGNFYNSHNKSFTCYANIKQVEIPTPFSENTLKSLLIASVEKRLHTDTEIGFFLSGGLDSSLICSIASKLLPHKIKTFSIGIGDSPDLKCARKVASHLGTDHTEIIFTEQEGLDALKSVIYHLESYDCTTIRASVPMFLMSKYVKQNTNIKVILSGEGADELFGGYLYLKYAPSLQQFQDETLFLLNKVHKHDVTRADRCVSAHGLELRVPFFDRELVDYVVAIDPMFKKQVIEKMILRDSFKGYLPDDILYRQKNGMSDAVGYSWVNFIRSFKTYDEDHFDSMQDKFVPNTPLTNEEMYYRTLYTEMFGSVDNVTHIWRPKWTNQSDPSAALLPEHIK